MKFLFPMPHLTRLKAMVQPWEPAVTGADQTRLAKFADEIGYDMIAIPEHFVVPHSHVELSGPHHFHAAAAQGYYAGATERIKLNSCIAILPLQHPIVTAKALSTIDWMSSGRIITTFAAGWDKEEFEAVGVNFHERGRMCDEYLAAIIELWTQESPSFEGKYVNFRDLAFEPKCFQKPHLPIWMGGIAEPVLKRTAKFATGWWPALIDPSEIPRCIDTIKSQPTFKGGPFEVVYALGTSRVGEGHVVVDDPNAQAGMSEQEIMDQLGWYQSMGVTMTSVPIPPVRDVEEFMDYSRWVIEEIKPKLG